MDFQTLLVGAIPPGLAILAEIANPVSEEIIVRHIVPTGTIPDDNATAAAAIANGAVKIALFIPTWISVTAGISAVLIGEVSLALCLTIISIWTLLWAVVGMRFFATVDYYNTGVYLSGGGKARTFSTLIVVLNAVVLMIIVSAWYRIPGWLWMEPTLSSASVSLPPSELAICCDQEFTSLVNYTLPEIIIPVPLPAAPPSPLSTTRQKIPAKKRGHAT